MWLSGMICSCKQNVRKPGVDIPLTYTNTHTHTSSDSHTVDTQLIMFNFKIFFARGHCKCTLKHAHTHCLGVVWYEGPCGLITTAQQTSINTAADTALSSGRTSESWGSIEKKFSTLPYHMRCYEMWNGKMSAVTQLESMSTSLGGTRW